MAVAPPPPRPRRAVESSASWRLTDRIGLALCWGAGLLLCALAGGIVLYMAYRGVQYLRPELLWTRPLSDPDQSKSGGFLDPLIGTVALTLIGTAIAVPLGVTTAVWLVEFGRPSWLARMVESCVEVIAGTPDIVLAIFGLVLFQQSVFKLLSFSAEGNAVFGRSFLTAGAMMALVALPFIVGATREALQTIPRHVREASFALGKTRAATIRRVLLPASRPGIATGTVLGMGRIVGDTAIVVILLGATLQLQRVNGPPLIGDLRGTGSTLTSYVYNNSPAGEGNAAEKAYAAAFVLLLVVIGLNLLAGRLGRMKVSWTN
jgi:phosphate transport system permease protein